MNTIEQEVMDQTYMASVVCEKHPLVIYHGNCMDGIASLWAAREWLYTVEAHAASYGKESPDVTGRDVYILDFSYPRDVLIEMHSKAKSLVVIDHHQSAMDALHGLAFANFDMSRSGCALTWLYFAEKANSAIAHDLNIPPILQYIEDRDIWKHALPDTKAISAYLQDSINWEGSVEDNLNFLSDMDEFWHGRYEDYVSKGEYILNARDKLVAETAKGVFYANMVVDGNNYSIPMCFSLFGIRSEVGHALASLPDNVHKVGVSIQGMHNGKFGLSFRGLEGTDLALSLAKTFGGGGHKCASGAAIDAKGLTQLLNSITHN